MATPFPFGSGNVLTAAQMNAITTLPVSTKTASYTLTVADLGTRVVMNSASPTTITVNTSIFGASDVVEILNIGAGVCTVTAGTCTVSTSGTLALVQNAGGTLTFISASASVFSATGVAATASALTLVKAQTIGTTVSSVEVTGAFSAAYENYLIIVSGGVSSGNPNLEMKLGATTSGYAYGNIYVEYTSTTVNGEASNSASNWTRVGRGSTNSLDGEVILKFPFETKRTTGNWRTSSAASGQLWSVGGGYVDNATSYTAFTLTASGGATMTGGTVRVYGYSNS